MNTLSEETDDAAFSGWREIIAPDAPGRQVSGTVEDHRYRADLAGDESRLPSPSRWLSPELIFQYQTPRLGFVFAELPHDRFLCLQRWEGTVLEVNCHEFTARLSDLSQKGPDEEATLVLDDVNSDDRELLRPGAIFYLNLGYRICQSGQRVRGVSLKFRRLPSWEADEVLDARERARKRLERIVRE